MNKWRDEIINFFRPDVKVKFLGEDDKVIKYTWKTFWHEFTSFVLKDINKVVVVDETNQMCMRDMDFKYKSPGLDGILPSWSDTWKVIGKCKFNYKSDDLKYLYNAIWVSMI
jgi:hypothetical protein